MPRIFDIVEVADQGSSEMVRRFPESGSGDFRLGSQLIVREAQTAVFFRDGKALDAFGPGRHTITTANIPLLTGLLSLPFRGETPFKAEAYFVNMREFLEQKWGTPEAISLRDKDLGMVRLRAFGTYSIQVANPQLFVNKVVGTQGIYETGQIENFLRGIIVAKLTDLLGESGKSLFDLPALYDEIGAGTKAKAQEDFSAQGINLKTLYINSIGPTPETAEAIEKRAAMGAIGDMDTFLKYQAAMGMREAAAAGGEAGTLTGAGVGLGAGVGMGAAMAQAMAQAMQPKAQKTMACPSCAAQIPADSKFCPQCGAKIGGGVTCPQCGAEAPAGSKFCPNCGAKLG